MEIVSTPILQRGKVVPVFTLSDTAGRPVSRTSYRGRKHLVLVFVANLASAKGYLQELASVLLTISAASGAIVVVTREHDILTYADQLLLSFPLLSDVDGATTSRFLPSDVCNGVFITDRYGELYYQSFADTVDDLPPASEIVSWIEAVDHQCSI